MANPLSVYIDGTRIIQFDRNHPLTGIQRRSLEQMDLRMDQGIHFAGEEIRDPNPLERARFVANKLINALTEGNDPLAAALCAWLGRKMPELHKVVATSDEQGMTIELVSTGEPETLAGNSTETVTVPVDALRKSSRRH